MGIVWGKSVGYLNTYYFVHLRVGRREYTLIRFKIRKKC